MTLLLILYAITGCVVSASVMGEQPTRNLRWFHLLFVFLVVAALWPLRVLDELENG